MRDGAYAIFIRRLRARARIGIHAFEAAPQEILISAAVLLRGRDREDALAPHDLDYDGIRAAMIELAGARPYRLQETLCSAILDRCFAEEAILAAVVQTEKPTVYPDAETVGCRMGRSHDPDLARDAWWLPAF